jgi:protein gp37
MAETKIEWADATWNPVTGCTKISDGCWNCYAERMAKRSAGRYGYPADEPFRVTMHPNRLEEPLRWRKPRRVFVCSMGDLFHGDVPFEYIARVFGRMHSAPQHTFQLLTKRPERMAAFVDWYQETWLKGFPHAFPDEYQHVWLGVTAETQAMADERIPLLLQIPAAVRFVSCEPLLEPILLDDGHASYLTCNNDCTDQDEDACESYTISGECFRGIDWVICGGESGPGARSMHPDWARSLRDQCTKNGTAFFFKQWGEWAPNCLCGTKNAHPTTPRPRPGKMGCMFRCGKKAAGALLDGREWRDMPTLRCGGVE